MVMPPRGRRVLRGVSSDAVGAWVDVSGLRKYPRPRCERGDQSEEVAESSVGGCQPFQRQADCSV